MRDAGRWLLRHEKRYSAACGFAAWKSWARLFDARDPRQRIIHFRFAAAVMAAPGLRCALEAITPRFFSTYLRTASPRPAAARSGSAADARRTDHARRRACPPSTASPRRPAIPERRSRSSRHRRRAPSRNRGTARHCRSGSKAAAASRPSEIPAAPRSFPARPILMLQHHAGRLSITIFRITFGVNTTDRVSG